MGSSARRAQHSRSPRSSGAHFTNRGGPRDRSHPLEVLQRKAGNRAVRSLLEHRPPDGRSPVGPSADAKPSSPAPRKMCSRCARRYRAGKPLNCAECEAALPAATPSAPRGGARNGDHRPRLALGNPDHPSEREAEQIADQVVRSSGPVSSPKTRIPSDDVATSIGRKSEHSESQPVHSPPPSPHGPRLDADRTSQIERVRAGGGRPLPHPTRTYFESAFGTDLSDVRIHTGPTAARSARAIGAQAYTIGRDVVFGRNGFRPGTVNGRHLLAHELTHVLQQRRGPEAVSPQLGVEDYPHCTEEITEVPDPEERLEDARGLAIRMTDSAIDGLEFAIRAREDDDVDLEGPIQDALATHLHNPTAREMRAAVRHLRRARGRLELPHRMICNTAGSGICREGVEGYAWPGTGPYIHLCPAAFVPGEHTTLPIVLLHEALHVIGLDQDCYVWEDCYGNLASGAAVNNEDSLTFFADAVHIEIIHL